MGSYNLASSLTMVVFPAPFSPISAIFSPASSRKLRLRTTVRSEPGYPNATSRNSKPDRIGRGATSAPARL